MFQVSAATKRASRKDISVEEPELLARLRRPGRLPIGLGGWLTVTPEVAAMLLEQNECNRPLRPDGVRGWIKKLTNGWFGSTRQDPIMIDPDHNLMNAQHRLNGIKASGLAVRMYLVVEPPENMRFYDRGIKRRIRDNLPREMHDLWSGKKIAAARTLFEQLTNQRRVEDEEITEFMAQNKIDEACSFAVKHSRRVPKGIYGVNSAQVFAAVALWHLNTDDKERLAEFLPMLATGEINGKEDRVAIRARNALQGISFRDRAGRSYAFFLVVKAIEYFLDRHCPKALRPSSQLPSHLKIPIE